MRPSEGGINVLPAPQRDAELAPLAAPAGKASRPGKRRASPVASTETFINHYFKRINPDIAATFTQDQRDAIKIMFGAREIANHFLEIRRSVPFGRRRFYFVFLFGPERRHFQRLHSRSAISVSFNIVFYLGVGLLLLAPVLALLYGTAF